jgi:hypothetical protein
MEISNCNVAEGTFPAARELDHVALHFLLVDNLVFESENAIVAPLAK